MKAVYVYLGDCPLCKKSLLAMVLASFFKPLPPDHPPGAEAGVTIRIWCGIPDHSSYLAEVPYSAFKEVRDGETLDLTKDERWDNPLS